MLFALKSVQGSGNEYNLPTTNLIKNYQMRMNKNNFPLEIVSGNLHSGTRNISTPLLYYSLSIIMLNCPCSCRTNIHLKK